MHYSSASAVYLHLILFCTDISCRCVSLDITWQFCLIHTHTTPLSMTPILWTSHVTHRCSWRRSSTCDSHITSRLKKKQWWNSMSLFIHTLHTKYFNFHFQLMWSVFLEICLLPVKSHENISRDFSTAHASHFYKSIFRASCFVIVQA